jgi:RES domain-containing protein
MAHGPVLLWRIANETPDLRASDLSGGGAKAIGGRWNRKGTPAVYASTSIALATLETLAHLGDTIAIRNSFLVRISVPASVWAVRAYVDVKSVPVTWMAEPPGITSIEIGNNWLEARSTALLVVPSVIVPEEHDVLINPMHPLARKLKATAVRQFVYDPRL